MRRLGVRVPSPALLFRYTRRDGSGANPAEGYPSGQREQTVNLPAKPTEVRILPPPPILLSGSGLSGNSSVVERQPSKLRVAGSNPVSRSSLYPIRGGQGPRRAPSGPPLGSLRAAEAGSSRFPQPGIFLQFRVDTPGASFLDYLACISTDGFRIAEAGRGTVSLSRGIGDQFGSEAELRHSVERQEAPPRAARSGRSRPRSSVGRAFAW